MDGEVGVCSCTRRGRAASIGSVHVFVFLPLSLSVWLVYLRALGGARNVRDSTARGLNTGTAGRGRGEGCVVGRVNKKFSKNF